LLGVFVGSFSFAWKQFSFDCRMLFVIFVCYYSSIALKGHLKHY